MTWEELVVDVTARHWKDGGITVKPTDTAQREAALAAGAEPFDPGMGAC